MTEYNTRRSTVRFKPDREERDTTPMALWPRNHAREHGRPIQGNPSRSDGAAAPIRDAQPRRRTAEKVTLHCTRCGWKKSIVAKKVVASYRGHYGYAHPNLRLPEPYECRDAVV
jgi:hypothetical protein